MYKGQAVVSAFDLNHSLRFGGEPQPLQFLCVVSTAHLWYLQQRRSVIGLAAFAVDQAEIPEILP